MRKQTILLLVLGVLTPILALAQAKVTARLDSTRIKVGSQCRLVVEVSARQGARILWPTLKDHHLSKEIEVVGQRTEGDNEEGQSTMRKVYTLTAWDEGRQTVPALTVDVDGKKYKTQAIALEVATVQTDSIRPDDSKPPYDIQELPFSQEEWTPIYLWSLLALLLTIVGWYLFSRLRSGKPIISRKQILRQEPPHQKALRRINEIKAARLEGGDDQKEYYTLLTEALRRYMSERFGFNAMEMTSQGDRPATEGGPGFHEDRRAARTLRHGRPREVCALRRRPPYRRDVSGQRGPIHRRHETGGHADGDMRGGDAERRGPQQATPQKGRPHRALADHRRHGGNSGLRSLHGLPAAVACHSDAGLAHQQNPAHQQKKEKNGIC